MNYNTTRTHLILPEYGRNIHEMVNHALTIEDRDDRNRAAEAIIVLMGQLNPHLRDVNDFTHKLWDHLFIISDYRLDVDSPYPKPDRERLAEKPDRLQYPTHKIRYRHYGRSIEMMIKAACEMEDGDEKTALTETIANLMKRHYLRWNRDSVDDSVIEKHLRELSAGKLTTPKNFDFEETADILKSQRGTNNKKKSSGKKKHKKRN
ncbi:MAG: methionyl-tRNA formyltransferase [Crocinitomicaceae bacterium]|nr:methionyl-tRNA formyltransferase [Crocinitomicaceae bacterium]|tara:strand:- start:492 stop:1109 length:618 start_codon:yes stop_codon:yes gene_type:complete